MDTQQFINGAVGGMCGLTFSHPVDTVKSNIQAGKPVSFRLSALFRGYFPPLGGMALEKAVVFGTYGNARRHTQELGTFGSIAVSGALAGLAASLVVGPYERLKIIRQTGGTLKLAHFKPTSLYRGLSATFTRETPGFAIYFSFYEAMKKKLYGDREITKTGSLVLGGATGMVAWFPIYPQDVVKTRLQSSETKLSATQVVSSIWKEAGFRGFYRGFHLALLRAVPLHAGTFWGVEMMSSFS